MHANLGPITPRSQSVNRFATGARGTTNGGRRKQTCTTPCEIKRGKQQSRPIGCIWFRTCFMHVLGRAVCSLLLAAREYNTSVVLRKCTQFTLDMEMSTVTDGVYWTAARNCTHTYCVLLSTIWVCVRSLWRLLRQLCVKFVIVGSSPECGCACGESVYGVEKCANDALVHSRITPFCMCSFRVLMAWPSLVQRHTKCVKCQQIHSFESTECLHCFILI